MDLSFYVAPMEGITGYIFRQCFREAFAAEGSSAAPQKYYMPFMSPQQDGSVKTKDKKDFDPANNQGIHAVPQVLTNRAESFLLAVRRMQELGYDEVNLNVGCPYATVVSKKKGAGFLTVPDQLNAFFDRVFQENDLPAISVKTRLAPVDMPEVNEQVFAIYEQYPISELIVHPRRQKDFYKGQTDMEMFDRIVHGSHHPLCYNGNLYTPEEVRRIAVDYPEVPAVMIGRGLLRNPALLRILAGGAPLSVEEFKAYHDQLYLAHEAVSFGPSAVLGRMKELWLYWETMLADSPKAMKAVYKAKKCEEYRSAVEVLFAQMQLLDPDERPRVTKKLDLIH